MRFHCVNLPHTQLDKSYSRCAYSSKVYKFKIMMEARGHTVYTYSNTVENQKKHGFNGPEDYLKIDFNDSKVWPEYNKHVIKQIKDNIKPRDIICVITGTPAQQIKDAFPDNLTVEFGVGYKGVMNPSFRVFESQAWRNYVYGRYDLDGAFYDEVIPNYFEVEDFPYGEAQDYYLFVGRLNANKGLNIAQDVCKRFKKRLIVAGPGDFEGYGEYVGVINPTERAKLMSGALALFCPTIYVPPFEGVHIEAMLCGTPVITTDFGVFCETVDNKTNGFRCRNLQEFMVAATLVPGLNRKLIRAHAQSKYSLEAVGVQYEAYFNRLLDLYKDGWYSQSITLKGNQPMSNQTDELRNIIASLQNIVEALDAQEKVDVETAPVVEPAAPVETPVTPSEPEVPTETPAVVPPEPVVPAVTSVPVIDGTVADNTPSATPQE